MIEKPSCQRSACTVHATAPVFASSATSWPSSRPRKIRPSPYATPRLVQPQQTTSIAGSSSDLYDQRICARRDVEREQIARARRHVDDAVDDERLRLAGVLRADAGAFELRAPHAFEVRDVAAVDLGQRRIALVVPIAAVRRPADGRRRHERRVGRLARTRAAASPTSATRRSGSARLHGPSTRFRHRQLPPKPVRARDYFFVPLKCWIPGLNVLSSRNAFIALARLSLAPKNSASPIFAYK